MSRPAGRRGQEVDGVEVSPGQDLPPSDRAGDEGGVDTYPGLAASRPDDELSPCEEISGKFSRTLEIRIGEHPSPGGPSVLGLSVVVVE